MIKYNETPIQEINDPLLDLAQVRLLIKREDLNHPFISGNKWWKLKYNLEEAKRQGKKKLLTFGGAYSNHIYATAAASNEMGLESVGIIRGEEMIPLNPTLTFAKRAGMHLHFISRESYQRKTELDFIMSLRKQFGDFYLIPEGGTNILAIKGCEEYAKMILKEINFDVLCLPVGTGGTLAGMILGIKGSKELIGFSSLKGGKFLEQEVKQIMQDFVEKSFTNWRIESEFHFGGYGKRTDDLVNFITIQKESRNLPLDVVYTSKMVFGIFELISRGRFMPNTTILAIHTGGLQSGEGVETN